MLSETHKTFVRLLFRYKDNLLEVWRSTLRREQLLAFLSFFKSWALNDFIDVVENDTEIALRTQFVLCVNAFASEWGLKFDHIIHLQKLTPGLCKLAITRSLCLHIDHTSVQ